MVPPYSHRVPRVRWYSGYCCSIRNFAYETFTLCGVPSQVLRLSLLVTCAVRTPKVFLLAVWPLPRSLATTCGISFDFFSSAYLDVSVQRVPPVTLCFRFQFTVYGFDSIGVSPFGHPRIGACLRLPEAFRSLPRPSSAPIAQAFALCSFLLDLRLSRICLNLSVV